MAAGATHPALTSTCRSQRGNWEHIGVYQGGIIPVQYQRVQCSRSGGVRFVINGFNYFELVNIRNLAGSGSVATAWVKGTNTGWIQMSRN
ncbi:hypothetical protein PR202_ga00334 [Eleusine coracana subsp. coracana]|uniref:Expansin n=1 Tax=Eleusine coracana subsp. coracana TaxID=191504 RepID=A0AAV5BC91_ELECO|nr:hypothetical protein PR202_ga00334 [Eleusine coracana subsp. coracana]